eukprot:RCo006988
MLLLGHANQANGAGLRHSPGMDHRDAKLVLKGLDHRPRCGSPTDHRALQVGQPQVALLHVLQQSQPHGGHAGGDGDTLALHKVVDTLAIQEGPREDALRAHHGAGVGDPPGVDVEHRHHRKDGIQGGHPHAVGQGDCQRVEDVGAVAVQHPLGVPRSTGGVAQRAGRVLLQHGPLVLRGALLHKRLVAQQVGDPAGLRHVRGVRHQHEVLHALQPGHELLDKGKQVELEKQHLVVAVVDDVHKLLREQPGIHGVQDRARPGDPVVQLQVPVAVPRQSPHGVALFHSKGLQGVGQLLAAGVGVGVGVAVDRALHGARNHLGVAVVLRGEVDHGRNVQLVVLHQPHHRAGVADRRPRGASGQSRAHH